MAITPETPKQSKETAARAPQHGVNQAPDFGTEWQVGISQEQLQRTLEQPASARPADILALQRMIGNRAVQRMLNPEADSQTTQVHTPASPAASAAASSRSGSSRPIIQRSLKVGAANDSYEQEADRVARQVMRPAPSAPAKGSGKRKSDDETLQMTPLLQLKSAAQQSSEAGFETNDEFQSRLNSTKGGGKALPEKTRSELEPRFGADLSAVRVHTSDASDALNRDVQAKAFTRGNDIHFSKGAYNPGSSAGKQLLAHELTHTIQQTGGSQLQPKRKGKDKESDIARAFDVKAAPGATIQRVNVTTGQMDSSIQFGEKFLNFFGFAKDAIFRDIKKQLEKYEKATTWSARLSPLRRMIDKVGTWMATHQKAMTKGSKKAKTLGQLLAEITIELNGIIKLGQQQGGQQQPALQGAPKVQAPQMPAMVQGAVQIPDTPTLQGTGKIKPPIPPQPIVQQAVQLVVQLQNVGKIAVQTPPQPLAQDAQVIDPNLLPPPQTPPQGQGQQGQQQQPPTKTPQQEDDDYMNQVDTKSLKYLSTHGVDMANKMKKFHDGSDNSTRGQKANAKISQYGLTLAEATAIGIYTAADYLYMNPASANIMPWMKAGLANKQEMKYQNPNTEAEINQGVTDQHAAEATLEGQLHNKIALKGLNKLPDWSGPPVTYRGVAFEAADLATKYPKGGETVFPAFTSTSKLSAKAKSFAMQNTVGTKVGALLVLTLTKGKSISKLSRYTDEKEILVLPGATFDVTDIQDNGGLKKIFLTQTK